MADGLTVLGDRHLSEQAITNLLTNADRYSTPGGAIHVDVRDGDQVTLRVRDEGPGIEDDVAQRLFRDRVAAGRGLGPRPLPGARHDGGDGRFRAARAADAGRGLRPALAEVAAHDEG